MTQKKAEDFSSASLRLVPSPRYFAKTNLLVQWGLAVVAGRDRGRWIDANNGICEGAEVARTSLVRCDRRSDHVVGGSRGTGHVRDAERVAALGAGGQLRVNQASAARSRGCAACAGQVRQRGRKADRRIARVVS